MKILVLGHMNGDVIDYVNPPRRSIAFVEEPGLLDKVNALTERYLRDTWIADDLEGTSKDPLTDPIIVGKTFMWEGSTFTFETPDKLVLVTSETGEGVLDRFLHTLRNEETFKKKSKGFIAAIDWKVVDICPIGYKRETLIGFADYRSFRNALSPENVFLKNQWIEFIVSGAYYYVKGQSIYYDPEDESSMEFFGYGAKEKIIQFIKDHDKEMTPQVETTEEEEETN